MQFEELHICNWQKLFSLGSVFQSMQMFIVMSCGHRLGCSFRSSSLGSEQVTKLTALIMYRSQRKSMIALSVKRQQKHAKTTHLGARAMLFEVIVPVFCLQINSIESCRSVGKLILRLGIDLLSGPHPWPFVGLITFTLLERTLDLQNWFKDVKSIDNVQPNRNRRI